MKITDQTRERAGWMIVSKPLREPFRDGSTVLVRTLVERLPERLRLAYFGDPKRPLRPGAADEVIAAPSMPLAPGLRDKARVLTALAHPRRLPMPLHFFFTPNRLTSSVVAVMQRLFAQRRVVQDLTSSHGAEQFAGLLRSLDAVVVHSDHARGVLRRAGIDPERVHCIRPGVVPSEPVSDPQRNRRLLFAGDLDRQVVDRLLVLGRALGSGALRDWTLCIASRMKSREDAGLRDRLCRELAGMLAGGCVELLGEVNDMDSLFRRASLQLFLADHVRRKVDLPLVLLEGMARGIPLLTVDVAPVVEILNCGRKHGLDPGRRVSAAELVSVVERTAAQEEILAEWGRAAHALVECEFSADSMAREYAHLYEAVSGFPRP